MTTSNATPPSRHPEVRASAARLRSMAAIVFTRDALRNVTIPDGLACPPSTRTVRLVRQASVSPW